MTRRLLFSFCVLIACRTFAQLPATRLFSVFPPGGKTGSTAELTISGSDLEEVNQLFFSDTNIVAKQKISASCQAELNKFLVTIPTNVSPGIYEARAFGRFGVSNPRAFSIDELPETSATNKNSSATTALTVALGSIVNGRATPNVIDHFKFRAKKNQRVLIECMAQQIDSKMEPALILLDMSGHELERSRNGDLLDFTAPAGGDFSLQLHDLIFRGGNEYFYRLTISTRPHLDFILPAAGVPGRKSKHTLYGRNLPNGKSCDAKIQGKILEQLEVEIAFPDRGEPAALFLKPAAAVLEGFNFRLASPNGVSNPFFLSFTQIPIMLEQEPNDKASQKISIPAEISGQFYPAHDVDYFSFDAKKGDALRREIFSHRLGKNTAPFMLIQRSKKNPMRKKFILPTTIQPRRSARFHAIRWPASKSRRTRRSVLKCAICSIKIEVILEIFIDSSSEKNRRISRLSHRHFRLPQPSQIQKPSLSQLPLCAEAKPGQLKLSRCVAMVSTERSRSARKGCLQAPRVRLRRWNQEKARQHFCSRRRRM